jgi:hypothetical protein
MSFSKKKPVTKLSSKKIVKSDLESESDKKSYSYGCFEKIDPDRDLDENCPDPQHSLQLEPA